MGWRTLIEAVAIDSHNVYVWCAYALAIGLVLLEIGMLHVRKRIILGYLR